MEALGAFLDGECDSFSRMLSTDQVLDFAPGQYPSNLCWSSLEPNMIMAGSPFCSLDALNSGLQYILQESDHQQSGCSSFSVSVPSSSYFNDTSSIPLTDNTHMDMPKLNMEDDKPKTEDAKKRRPQDSKDVQKMNTSKKMKKLNSNGSEQEGRSSSSCSSEDPQTPLSGKRRASKGSATYPQSLYARKRREKINERLRILQNLVPNGTKVDISTMLEEAVHYVKFLELQIKLLSSDNMWMYSPIAYNGMDIGHNGTMS